ncbi:MAG: ribose-phosphate pyrophosphokinae [Conexibacter sp.]|nr:ribose-phosphate pyrophosphokinae [Conexibacter sp.]
MPTHLPLDYDKRLMLFAGRASNELADAIAVRLGVEAGPVDLQTYASGEMYCRYEESVRGADVFVVQSLAGTRDGRLSLNDALMELTLMIDAAVGASAHRVIAVIPWFGYSRQDMKSRLREPISARVVARMLESVGVSRVLTVDLHTGQAQGFFRVPVDHMTSLHTLTDDLRERLPADAVVVAPDAGRVKLAKKFATHLGAELAILDPEAAHDSHRVIGEVAGREVVVVDDIIDTGRTLAAAVEALRDEGVTSIRAVAMHPVLSAGTPERIAALGLEELLVTDTVGIPAGVPQELRVVSCADLLADTIHRIFVDDSVAEAFGGDNI